VLICLAKILKKFVLAGNKDKLALKFHIKRNFDDRKKAIGCPGFP
jgi:hypothetical protein